MRSAPVSLGAGAALVVVAGLLAASGDGDTTTAIPGIGLSSAWLSVMLGALGAFTLVVWIGLVITAIAGDKEDPGTRPSRTIPGMLLAGAMLWLLFTVWDPAEEPNVIAPPPIDQTSTTLDHAESADEPGASATDGAWVLVGAAVVLAGVAAVGWSLRRRLVPVIAEDEVTRRRRVLVGLFDEALADLRGHPDPRAAVIAAWARMEDALAAVDVPRRPSDTPARYVSRVLTAVDTSAAAVAGFTGTFERAMFAPDDITAADQQNAVDALTAIRDELHLLSQSPVVRVPR